MKRFAYKSATTVAEASSMLAGGNAAILAGGGDIINVMRTGALPNPPETLVNIKNIPGLNSITEDASGLKIGATAKLADIAKSSIVKGKWSALAESALKAASPTLREMGTLGGNLCQEVECWYWRRSHMTGNWFNCFRKGGTLCYAVTGDNRYHAILGGATCFAVCPSDTAIALTALNASIVTNKRTIPIGDFFVVLGNILANDEIITQVTVPVPAANTKQVFIKFAERPTIDFALVSVCAAITTSGGNVSDARIVLGAVAPVPYRATAAENLLKGKAISESLAAQAGDAAVQNAVPLPKNKYKVQITKTLVKRAILA
jgi:xanthine dehydrogenase YagS FAD-binding subunit